MENEIYLCSSKWNIIQHKQRNNKLQRGRSPAMNQPPWTPSHQERFLPARVTHVMLYVTFQAAGASSQPLHAGLVLPWSSLIYSDMYACRKQPVLNTQHPMLLSNVTLNYPCFKAAQSQSVIWYVTVKTNMKSNLIHYFTVWN